MHMMNASVLMSVACVMMVLSAIVAGVSIKKVLDRKDPERLPMLCVMAGVALALQMIEVKMGNTGFVATFSGAVLMAGLVGPYMGYLGMMVVVLVKTLLFASNPLACGLNVWNMAFYGTIVGTFVIYRPILKAGVTRNKLMVASFLATVVSALLVGVTGLVECVLAGSVDFASGLAVIVPAYLVFGAIEGVLTALVLTFVFESRPVMLQGFYARKSKSKKSYKQTFSTVLACALLVVVVSLVVTFMNPSGIPWPIMPLEETVVSSMPYYVGSVLGALCLVVGYGLATKQFEKE